MNNTQASWRIRLIVSGVALVILGAAVWHFVLRSMSTAPLVPDHTANPDPRLVFATPYRNVHPDVQYVGDAACAPCHAEQCGTYQHHPMARDLFTQAKAPRIERLTPDAKNPFTASGLHYSVELHGAKMFHTEAAHTLAGEVIAARREEIAFAMGSGAKARSYIVNREGYLYQSPLTWYPEQQRWDISPGYETRNFHFSRSVGPQCLFCHSNYAEHVPGTVNKYKGDIFKGLTIGCERCHGPGQLHAQERLTGSYQGAFDPTIVNPAKLEHSLREAVCQQCHVQGEQRVLARGRGVFDYRPGLPLHLFHMDFVDSQRDRDDFKFVSSVEQMQSSKCYQASDGDKKLGCISCHDSHQHPTAVQKLTHYRTRCMQCHTDQACAVSLATRQTKNNNSCVACHMPARASEVNHSAITDHRIPRKPAPEPKVAPPRKTPGPNDLVPFHRHLLNADDPEVERNRGLAIMAMFDRGMPEAFEKQYAQAAVPLLEAARQRDPRDTPAALALANAYWSLGRLDEAATLLVTILEREPQLELAHVAAAQLALARKQPDVARQHWEAALKLNPWPWNYHHGLAVTQLRLGNLSAALAATKEASQRDLANPQPRSLRIQCLLALGHPTEADVEYQLLRTLTPKERHSSLAIWYDELQQQYPRRK